MRALYFEGLKGVDIVEKPVPEELKEEAEARRLELIERVSDVGGPT